MASFLSSSLASQVLAIAGMSLAALMGGGNDPARSAARDGVQVPSETPATSNRKQDVNYEQVRQRLALESCGGSPPAYYDHARTPLFWVIQIKMKQLSFECAVSPGPIPHSLGYDGSIRVAGDRLPVTAIAPDSDIYGQGSIILQALGGPGGHIEVEEADPTVKALLTAGHTLVRVGYAGTRYRSSYPSPDLFRAAQELCSYAERLSEANKDTDIYLYGESLGGFVAAVALSICPDVPVRRAILVGPLMYSPADAAANFITLRGRRQIADYNLSFLPRDGTKRPFEVQSHDAFKAFFPAHASHKGLSHYLRGTTVPVTIIYGEQDEVIGVEEAPKVVESRANVDVIALPGEGHATSKRIVDAVVRAMTSKQ